MIHTITDKVFGNYNINDELIHKYENITSYKYTSCKAELIITSSLDETSQEDKEIYYVFDCPGEDALFHWISECFIFYPLLLKLKESYHNIKILTRNTKKYVKNIFKFFNINIEITNTIKPNNVCFFSPIISLNELNFKKDLYLKYIHAYIDNINLLLSNNGLPDNKIILLPRNNKDNYVPNERTIPGIEDIEQNIIDNGGVVLNTYQMNNIHIQWAIIQSSEIIILDYGSSFFFNCIFLKNKKIIVLDNYNSLKGQINFISIKILIDIIRDNNTLIMVNNPNNDNTIYYNNIKHFLEY
jgi:hypothetical protein